MSPRYWMITNRTVSGAKEQPSLGESIARDLTYWVSEGGPLTSLKNWKKVSERVFRQYLLQTADQFPLIRDPEEHDQQQHVTLFIHGYNNDWEDAARRYQQICQDLFAPPRNLGHCVLFTWPSNGRLTSYYPDRRDARKTADQLAEVLNQLYDHLVGKQKEKDPEHQCRAKTSIIAHSMGNYVLQEALRHCWDRNDRPMLVSLLNQLIMVAADVDNDLFKSGEVSDGSAGDAIAQLTYRVTSLFSGRDKTLGLSAGLKHFGKRRLGRSGLDRNYPVPDNVWDVDCSTIISPDPPESVHRAYFTEPPVLTLMEQILKGVDRREILRLELIPAIHRTA